MQFELLSLDDAALVASTTEIENEIWDWCPWPSADFIHSIRAFPDDKLMECHVLVENGQVTAQTTIHETFWLATPGQAQIGVGSRDRDTDRYRKAVEHALASLRKLGFSRFMLAAPSKEEGYCRTLESLGFSCTMRQKVSRLEIESFEPSPGLSDGWELVTFPEYEAMNPEGFRHELWSLIQEILIDVPMPEPFDKEPFDDWCREYFKPNLDLEARVLALKDGTPIGLSEIAPNKVFPTKGLTGLTGIRRPFRRQGIARQLKIASILKAKEKGVLELFTDNEENNPMYLLNVELGFRHVWDICVYTLND